MSSPMTRKLAAAAVLAMALGGCSLFEPAKSPPGTPQRACEDAADADPKIRDYWSTQPSGASPFEFQTGYKEARAKAISDCLRIRAGRPAGGVERVIK